MTDHPQVARTLPVPEVVLSVHGVGFHEHGETRRALARVWGTTTPFDIVDFNWCDAVESDEMNRIARLSGAIASANGLRPPHVGGLSTLASLNDLLWGSALLVVPLLPLLVVPSVVSRLLAPESSREIWGLQLALRIARSLALAGLAVSAVLLLVGLAAAIVRRRRTGLWLLRTSLLSVLQPVLATLFGLAPLRSPMLLIGRLALAWAGLQLAFFLLVLAIAYGLALLLGTGTVASETNAQFLDMVTTAFAVGAACLVVGALLALIAHWLSVPLKLASDVFNYVGDEQQRTTIQRELDSHVRRLPAGADVTIVAHSLGSVIAVDSLTNGASWGHVGSVVLVTGGSPIRRWFQRFFPAQLFSDDVHVALQQMQDRSPLIAWINVYRERDPVGAALGFGDESTARDVPTRQPELRSLAAHAGYWSDQRVHAAVRQAWATTPANRPSEQRPTGSGRRVTASPTPGRKIVEESAPFALVAATLVAIVAGPIMAFQNLDTLERRTTDVVAEAVRSGRRVDATVTHVRVARREPPGGTYYIDRFDFVYDGPGSSETRRFEINPDNAWPKPRYFDADAMLADHRPADDVNQPATFEIEIALAPDDPTTLTVPDYPPLAQERTWWTNMLIVIFAIVVVALIGTPALWLSVYITSYLLPESHRPW